MGREVVGGWDICTLLERGGELLCFVSFWKMERLRGWWEREMAALGRVASGGCRWFSLQKKGAGIWDIYIVLFSFYIQAVNRSKGHSDAVTASHVGTVSTQSPQSLPVDEEQYRHRQERHG